MEQAPKPTEAPKPKSKKTWVAVVAVVIIVIIGVAAYYFTLPPAGTPVSIFENPAGSCSTATNCGYTPSSRSVSLNTKVVWTNNGQLVHTVTTNATANGSLPTFDSGSMPGGGATFSHTFTVAGNYKYYCTIHPWMKAEVVAA